MKIKVLERFLKKQHKYRKVVHRGMLWAGYYNKKNDPADDSNFAIDAYIIHPVYIACRAIGRAFKEQAKAQSYMTPDRYPLN